MATGLKGLLLELKKKSVSWPEKIRLSYKALDSLHHLHPSAIQLLLDWVFQELSRIHNRRVECPDAVIEEVWTVAEDISKRVAAIRNEINTIELPKTARDLFFQMSESDFAICSSVSRTLEYILGNESLSQIIISKFDNFLAFISKVINAVELLLKKDNTKTISHLHEHALSMLIVLLQKFRQVANNRANARQVGITFCKKCFHRIVTLYHGMTKHASLSTKIAEHATLIKELLINLTVDLLCKRGIFSDLEQNNMIQFGDAYAVLFKELENTLVLSSDLIPSVAVFIGCIYKGVLQGNMTWELFDSLLLLQLFMKFASVSNRINDSATVQDARNCYVQICYTLLPHLLKSEVFTSGGDTDFGEAVTQLSINIATNLIGDIDVKLSIQQLTALKSLLSVSHSFAEPHMSDLLKLCLISKEGCPISEPLKEARCALLTSLLQIYFHLKQLNRFFDLFLDALYYLRKLLTEDVKINLPIGILASLEEVVSQSTSAQVTEIISSMLDAIDRRYFAFIYDSENISSSQQSLAILHVLLPLVEVIAMHAKNILPNEYNGTFKVTLRQFLEKGVEICDKFGSSVANLPKVLKTDVWIVVLRLQKLLLEILIPVISYGYSNALDEFVWESNLGCYTPHYFTECDPLVVDDPRIQFLLSEIFICKSREMLVSGKEPHTEHNIISKLLFKLQNSNFSPWQGVVMSVDITNIGTCIFQLVCANFPVLFHSLNVGCSFQIFGRHISSLLMNKEVLQLASCTKTSQDVFASDIAANFIASSFFYEVLEIQASFVDTMIMTVHQSLPESEHESTSILKIISSSDFVSNVNCSKSNEATDKANDDDSVEGKCVGSNEQSIQLSWTDVVHRACAGSRCLHFSQSLLVSVTCFADICKLMDISRLQPRILAKLCCVHVYIVQYLMNHVGSDGGRRIITSCLRFLFEASVLAIDRDIASCWSLISVRPILKWVLSLQGIISMEHWDHDLEVVGVIGGVLLKFRGPRVAESIQEIFSDFLQEGQDANQCPEYKLRCLKKLLTSAVNVLESKHVSVYTRKSCLDLARVLTPFLLHSVSLQYDDSLDNRRRICITMSALAKLIRVNFLSGALKDTSDTGQTKDCSLEEAITHALAFMKRVSETSGVSTVDEDFITSAVDLLRVLCDDMPSLEIPTLRNVMFWESFSSLACNFIISTDKLMSSPENNQQSSVCLFLFSVLINGNENVKADLLQKLTDLYCNGFAHQTIRRKVVRLWNTLLSYNWKKDKLPLLKPAVWTVVLSSIHSLTDPELTGNAGLRKELLLLVTKFLNFGHGLVPHSVVMSCLNICVVSNKSNRSLINYDIIKGYYYLLSAILYKHTAVVENCIHTFMTCLHNLLLLVVGLVTVNSALKEEIGCKENSDRVLDCFVYLGRLYQEFGSHKGRFQKYAPYLLANYLKTTKNASIPTTLLRYLNSGIFIILDSCGHHQFSLLHTVLSPDERDLFSDLYNEYMRHHRYQGKA